MFSIVLNLFKFNKQNSIPGVQMVSRAQIQHSGSHDEKSFSKNQPGDYFKYPTKNLNIILNTYPCLFLFYNYKSFNLHHF